MSLLHRSAYQGSQSRRGLARGSHRKLADCRRFARWRRSHTRRHGTEVLRQRLKHFSSRGLAERQARVHLLFAAASLTAAASTAFAGIVEIVITLTSTSTLPNTVRSPMLSPPKKYPTKTATTGFTYA